MALLGLENAKGMVKHPLRRLVWLVVLVGVPLLMLFSGSFGVIQTGNVGVRTTLGQVSLEEVPPGVYVKWPFISRVQEFTAKEISIDINDITPKARDNLSLRDMDITLYYGVAADKVAELEVKYAGQTSWDSDTALYLPGYGVVYRLLRNVAYEEVARIDSLQVHTKRNELANAILDNIQRELNHNDPAVFHVTRVVLRSITTDPSIEQSIQQAVANQKKLEAMTVQTEIAKKEAEVRVTEAHGIAEANRIIANSLTREYLQHEANQALMKFADNGRSNTVILPAGQPIEPLISIPAPSDAPNKAPVQGR